jgi:hypothetical protein
MDTTYDVLSQYDCLSDTVDVTSPSLPYVERRTTTKERMTRVEAPVTPLRIKTLSNAAVYKRQVARSQQNDLIESWLLGIFCCVHPLLAVVVGTAVV